VPFYVALPGSSIDWSIRDGVKEIPIEERAADEVTTIAGRGPDGRVQKVIVAPEGSSAANPGFDVTPAALVTGIITERGVTPATEEGLAALYRR
jgi:methylthioribose-1-phosphate isomerase